MSIRSKLLIVLLLVSIVPLITVGLIAMENSEKALKKHIGISSLEYTQLLAERINEYFYSKYEDNQEWVKDEIMLEVLTGDINGRLSKILELIGEHYNDYHYIFCMDKKGRVVASSNPTIIGMNFFYEGGFREALK